MSEEISIGLLLGSAQPPCWFVQSLEQIEQDTSGSIEKIFVAKSSSIDVEKDLQFYIEDIREKGCWAPVAIGQKIARKIVGPIPELQSKPISEAMLNSDRGIEYFNPVPESRFRLSIPSTVVESLATTDVVLHWGVGILEGDILYAPKFGVWGIHHGNIRRYRGGPPGFWEFVHGVEHTAVTLQQYTEELDAGAIVAEREIDISDARNWRAIRRKQCQVTPPVITKGIRSVVDGTLEITSPDELGPVYRPSNRDCGVTIRYLAKTITSWLMKAKNEILYR